LLANSNINGVNKLRMAHIVWNVLAARRGHSFTISMCGKKQATDREGGGEGEGRTAKLWNYTDKVHIDKDLPIKRTHVYMVKLAAVMMRRLSSTQFYEPLMSAAAAACAFMAALALGVDGTPSPKTESSNSSTRT
jgi:hypothetical protein